MLGYLPKETASEVAQQVDNGRCIRVTVSQVTGGNGYNFGANIYVELSDNRFLTDDEYDAMLDGMDYDEDDDYRDEY